MVGIYNRGIRTRAGGVGWCQSGLGIVVSIFGLERKNMRFSTTFIMASVAQAAAVVRQTEGFAPGADGKYTISAPGIKAQVCPFS